MKFSIDKDNFLKTVLIADSVVSSKNINSILGNCLFEINGSVLKISGTDNEISVKNKTDVVSDVDGTFTLNGKKLIQILKELPKGEIDISVDESYSIIIKSKSKDIKGSYTLVGTGRLEYPDIPDFKEDNSIEIDQVILKEMIRKVSYAAAIDTIKPAFNGIYFISEKDGFLTAVASDSRRLSISTKTVKECSLFKEGIIIPLKTINELSKLLSNGICHFSSYGNQCFFMIGKTQIISRIIDGQFPNYNQVIPKDYIIKSYINKDKLMVSLRRTMIFTKEPSFKIVLNFSKEKLTIEAKTAEMGEATEDIIVDTQSSEKIVIGLNSQYLMDCLKECETETIEIGITGQMSPLTIKQENKDDSIAVIMPIQIRVTE